MSLNTKMELSSNRERNSYKLSTSRWTLRAHRSNQAEPFIQGCAKEKSQNAN